MAPDEQLDGRDILVIGASAGGVQAVSELTAGLPRDLPAAVCVVIHFDAWLPEHVVRGAKEYVATARAIGHQGRNPLR